MALRMFDYVCQEPLFSNVYVSFNVTKSLAFCDGSGTPTISCINSNKGIKQWFMNSLYKPYSMSILGRYIMYGL